MKDESRHSYIAFYGRDWLGDSMLRMCTANERGVWIDLLCVMMSGVPYGHLAINNRAMTDSEVARVIGLDEKAYKDIFHSLLEKGIPSKTNDGIVYSRRLVRDHKRFTDGSKYGKKGGGNPALRKDEESHSPDVVVVDAESDLWSLDEVLKIASGPDVAMTKQMATDCYDYYHSLGWRKKGSDHVNAKASEVKSLLRSWKVRQPSMGKTDAPGTGTPLAKRKESFDEMVSELCQRLVEHGEDQEGFRRTCKAWADKSRDLGKVAGLDVVGTALDILKKRVKK